MKIFKLFLLAIIVLNVASCSNNDDGPAVIELTVANVTGTYDITFFQRSIIETKTASNGTQVLIENSTEVADTFTNAIIVLNPDGTYVSSGGFRITRTKTVNGQTTTESEINTFDDDGNFSINNQSNTLTLDDEVFEVIAFNGVNMTIRSEQVFTFDDETVTNTSEIRLVKQN